MIPKIVDIGEIKVIGLQKTCQETNSAAEKANLRKQFRQFAIEIPNQIDGDVMEICLQKHGCLITHCIAIEVNSADIVPSGMISLSIPRSSTFTWSIADMPKPFGSLSIKSSNGRKAITAGLIPVNL